MDYEKMLDRLYMSLPNEALKHERFEMPVAESFVQGSRTIVKNFQAITKAFGRDQNHISKFLTKELAAPMNIEQGRLIINSKFSNTAIQRALQKYAESYVLCHECKRPDTRIAEEHGVKVLKCIACGAISPIKKL